MTTPETEPECGVREQEPRTGTSPCVLAAGHSGAHQDRWTNQWAPGGEPKPLWADLLGAAPDITGGACPQCYMDRSRGRDHDMSPEHAHCRAVLDEPAAGVVQPEPDTKRRACTGECDPTTGAYTHRPGCPDAQPDTERRERYAAAMREHYLTDQRDEADADGNLPCRCGDWREPGEMGSDEDDWDSHLADAAMAVADKEQQEFRTMATRLLQKANKRQQDAVSWAETVASHGTGPTTTVDIDINLPGTPEPAPMELPLDAARMLHTMLGNAIRQGTAPTDEEQLVEQLAEALDACRSLIPTAQAEAILPIVHAAEIAAVRRALTEAERQFLTFALDLAFDEMVSNDGFTDDDHAALEKFRAMTATEEPTS